MFIYKYTVLLISKYGLSMHTFFFQFSSQVECVKGYKTACLYQYVIWHLYVLLSFSGVLKSGKIKIHTPFPPPPSSCATAVLTIEVMLLTLVSSISWC
jgi:hypothetical protein